jgi:predicted metalloendopeptidase
MPKIGNYRRALALGLCPLALLLPFGAGGGAPKLASAGVNTSGMDRSVRPGDDFYTFANGAWARETEIPADRASVGGFYIADQSTEKRSLHWWPTSWPGASATGQHGREDPRLLPRLSDTAAINAKGMAPVQGDLSRFAAIANKGELSRVLGEQIRADVDPLNATDFQTENLFGLFITQSLNGTAVMPYVLQGGLGLPEREYYLSSDAKMGDIRAKYRAYIATILTDAGLAATPADAEARAGRIFDLESKIAQAHESREQSEDFQHANAEWTRADFAKKAPGIDWDTFFTAAGLPHQINLPLSTISRSRALPRWSPRTAGCVEGLAGLSSGQPICLVLPTKIDDDRFAFYGAVLQGVKVQRSRERRAIAALNGALGDALGKLYVEKYFPASDKARIQAMVSGIKDAFAVRIGKLDWMAPATKKEAIAKVRGIVVGVGYPDHWKDYSALKLGTDAYANAKAAGLNDYRQQLAKIGKPMDRGEWWMNAQLVNAVNLPVQNALNFPAAILQKPFYDPAADAAFNYGAIGAVIGHEISHSFDNNGAAFDASGRLRDWWTPADMARFKQAGKALADQFSAYEPYPGLHVQGELTLGENIADVAGLAAALGAYHASLKGKPAPVINGMTGDQRFFLAFAQSWATKAREAAARAHCHRWPCAGAVSRADGPQRR